MFLMKHFYLRFITNFKNGWVKVLSDSVPWPDVFRSYPQAKNSIKIHIIFYTPLIPYFKRNYFYFFLVIFFSKEINKLSTTCIHIPLDSHNFKKLNSPTLLYKNCHNSIKKFLLKLQFLFQKILSIKIYSN